MCINCKEKENMMWHINSDADRRVYICNSKFAHVFIYHIIDEVFYIENIA